MVAVDHGRRYGRGIVGLAPGLSCLAWRVSCERQWIPVFTEMTDSETAAPLPYVYSPNLLASARNSGARSSRCRAKAMLAAKKPILEPQS